MDDPKSVIPLVRAMMPTEVTVEHREKPARNAEEIMRRMEKVGVQPSLLEHLSAIRFHTPQEVLELTAKDVTDDDHEC